MSLRSIVVVAGLAAFGLGCATARKTAADGTAERVVDESWRANRPAPGEPPELVTPTIRKAVLDNGLEVYVAERHDLPIVSINVAFAAGSANDPPGKAGLAEITYLTLLEGAGDLDALALDEAFADLGTSAFASVSYDGALVGTQVLTRNLDEAARLLAEIVLRPRFRPESFERRKQLQLGSLAGMVGNPRYLASVAFSEAVFGKDHPYGQPRSGTPESVGGLQLADAKAFWQRHAGPKAAAFVAAGDITLEEAVELARRYFGGWRGEATRPPKPSAATTGTERKAVVFVPKAGLNQTVIQVGRPALEAGHPDQYALELASTVFGGFFGSRLNMNLREERGYTYGARAWVDPRRAVGPLVASSSVRADVTGPALEQFIAEMEELKTRPIGPDELEPAREGLIRSLPGSFETVGGLAATAAWLYWMEEPLDYYARLVEGIERTSAEAVQAAAEKYFDPAQMQIVLVGDPDVIREQVAPLGLGPLEEETPVQPGPTP